jgi:hypothetical protein
MSGSREEFLKYTEKWAGIIISPTSAVLTKERPQDMKEPFITLKTFITVEKQTFCTS